MHGYNGIWCANSHIWMPDNEKYIIFLNYIVTPGITKKGFQHPNYEGEITSFWLYINYLQNVVISLLFLVVESPFLQSYLCFRTFKYMAFVA